MVRPTDPTGRREKHRREEAARRARKRATPEYRTRMRAKHGLILGLRPSIWANLTLQDCGYKTPCLVWGGGTSDKGYGVTSMGGRQHYVHRLVYEAVNGAMSKYLNGKRVVSDHLCRNHPCANPDHIEPVTDGTNVLRGVSFAAVNAAKTYCDHGHEFTPANTRYEADGSRVCQECKRVGHRRRNEQRTARRRAARTPVPKVPRPAKPPRDLAPCGTLAARLRHVRKGEPIDAACRQAHSESMRQWRETRSQPKNGRAA